MSKNDMNKNVHASVIQKRWGKKGKTQMSINSMNMSLFIHTVNYYTTIENNQLASYNHMDKSHKC